MNRNMMIGGVVAIIVVIILVVVFVMGGDDEEENGDGGGGDAVTSESMTSAFQAVLDGDAGPASELTCEEDQPVIEGLAQTFSAAREEAPEDAEFNASCEVEGDTATCTLTLAGVEQTQTFNIVDGLVCGVTAP
jgi:hypothetical protein